MSEYPCSFDKLGLDNIEVLKNKFNNAVIGLSDHFNGILSYSVGYLKGLEFLKNMSHSTDLEGTDHSFALEPNGFNKFVRDIKRVRHMLIPKESCLVGKEPVFKKLGKSIIASKNLKKGDVLDLYNLSGKFLKNPLFQLEKS